MLHEQKLQSLDCWDQRVENTKLNWPTVISCLLATEWLFKYSVSKPPNVLRKVSLLVLFVQNFWNDSVKVSIVSLISSILDANCCYFPCSFGRYAVQSSARWSLNCYNKNFLAPIFTKYAARSRNLLQSYFETGSRPTFLNYTYLIYTMKRTECDTLRLLEHCCGRTAYFRFMFVIISWSVKAQVAFRNDFRASNIRKSVH